MRGPIPPVGGVAEPEAVVDRRDAFRVNRIGPAPSERATIGSVPYPPARPAPQVEISPADPSMPINPGAATILFRRGIVNVAIPIL
jgi:hypothetical protein